MYAFNERKTIGKNHRTREEHSALVVEGSNPSGRTVKPHNYLIMRLFNFCQWYWKCLYV